MQRKVRPESSGPFAFLKGSRQRGEILDIAICVAIVCLAAYVIAFIYPALAARLFYAGPLEQQEELTLNTLRFMRAGGNIYQAPDLHFAGTIYPPFYFFAALPFTELFGLGFTPLRAFSLLAIAGTVACAYAMIRQTTGNRWAAAAWLPLFLAVWPIYGWIDIARLEALFMFFIFAGACCCVSARGKMWMYALGGCLLGLAAATKQPGFAFVPLACLMPFLDRRAIYVPLAMLAAVAVVYGAGFWLYGPGLYDWVFAIPSHHPRKIEQGLYILGNWVTLCAGIAVLSLMFAVLVVKNEKIAPADTLVLAVTAIIGCAAALPPMSKLGGALLSLTLLNAFAILAGCYVVGDALRSSGILKKTGALLALVLVFISAVAFVAEGYVGDRTPRPEYAAAYENLVAFVKSSPGDVWVANHPWVNTLAGKESFVPLQQMGGEWALGNPGARLPVDLTEAIRQHRFSMIVLGQEYLSMTMGESFENVLNANYRESGTLPPDTGVAQIDGLGLTVDQVWVPK